MALDPGCQGSCADPRQPGHSSEKLALPSCPATHAGEGWRQWRPDPEPEQNWPRAFAGQWEPAGASRGLDPGVREAEGTGLTPVGPCSGAESPPLRC